MGSYPQVQMHMQQSSMYGSAANASAIVSSGVLPPPQPAKVILHQVAVKNYRLNFALALIILT